MKERIAQVGGWIEDRTGLVGGISHFLNEEIPASSGWHQVFGSMALFLFMVQAFTGILLAFNYAPTPGLAYDSLRYILIEVTGGSLIRGLHHWGASMIIVVVGLHLVQVFLWGAYKKPRESTWMVGVVLLLVTLAYGLTGYLLPWDNRAYWGTMVTTQIAGSAPVLGPYLMRLLGAGSGIGVVTFARFYAVHVLILPPATILLVVLHVYLVRKHGVAPSPGDELVPRKRFFPVQVFKDTVAIFIAFAILFTMAMFAHVPLEQMADPTDTSYIPRPEWYFLFLFQTLKAFNGPLEIVGSVVLPGLAVLTLILVPFIDRSKLVKVTQRTLAIGIVVLAAVGWIGLTSGAVASTPKQVLEVDFSKPTNWMSVPPERVASVATPDMPSYVIKGAAIYVDKRCAACHSINGVGGTMGPSLNGLSRRQTKDWVMRHFVDPQKLSPGSLMPPYKLPENDLNNLTLYLLTLPAR
jgi:ubiquinol-cytochrome c reductase cytochrome b subunit